MITERYEKAKTTAVEKPRTTLNRAAVTSRNARTVLYAYYHPHRRRCRRHRAVVIPSSLMLLYVYIYVLYCSRGE